jgi:pimeloyl-ACP methyl ester carboxylesterase
VLEFRAARPDAPVFMVAKSAGTAVVVRALEQLPPDSVERAILLAPALSPCYDLTAALRAVRSEAVVFWSPFDLFMLGLGTLLFGTVDRARCRSAGKVGFRLPPEPSSETLAAYRRLRQIPWRLPMALTGYCGGHFGTNLPTFLARYVLPLLRPAGAS